MRERLAALFDEDRQAVHTFTAQFAKFSRTETGANVACLVQIKHGFHFACDHAWVHRSKAMKQLELQTGDRVLFEAQIERYVRPGIVLNSCDLEHEYGLTKVRNMMIIERRES